MPSPSRSELKRRSKDSKKLYCGDRDELPSGYWNFGTRSQCTRKGVGIGMYVVPKQKSIDRKIKNKERKKIKSRLRSKKKKTIDDIDREKEMDDSDEEDRIHSLDNKEIYKEFVDDHFDQVLDRSKNLKNIKKLEIGEIFKRLSVLWKIEQNLSKKGYKERDKNRKKEMREI